MKWVRALALAACALAWPVQSAAQQSIEFASVSGRVVDPSNAPVADAEVRARHTATNVASTTTTDRDGRFRFPYLRVGPYEVTVSLPGFQEASRTLTLSVGAAFELPVTLALAGVDTNIVVSAETPTIETARSQIAGTISEGEVRTLPLNGRNFLDLALLVPGVSPTNVASTQLFPETSAVPGISLSIGSQRNLSNNFIVDGLSANDDAAALSGMTYGVDAVEQFQVVTSGGQAELGRALGGYVNVVTRSGTNVLHGTAYDFVRDDSLNARNPLSGTRLPMRQSQYGGSIGGPLAPNRTFYFANAEQRRLDLSGLTTIAPANVAAINARLDATGYPGPRLTTGVYESPIDSTNALVKMNHQLGARDQLAVRYSLYDISAQNARGAGALSAPSASTSLDNTDQTIAVSNTLVLSTRTVLETRAQFASSSLDAPPTDPVGPAVAIAGVATFGTSSSSPTARQTTMVQVVNNVSHQAGAHALRAGADFLYNDSRITYPRAFRGSYTFSSLATFLTGVYNTAGYTQTFGADAVSLTNPNAGLYAQDEWKLSPGLTANLGVRYDLQFLDTIHTDAGNLSPRAGLAWSPFESRRTLVRASAGLFYDRVPLRPLANALLSASNTTDLAQLRQIGVSLSPAQASAPVFPAVLTSVVPSVTLVNLTTMDQDLENAYSRQASVEVEQQVGARTTLSAGYQYLRGRRLLMSINQNVPSCAAAGGNNGCRPIPDYANNSQYSGAGDSTYHGLHLTFAQRPGSWSSVRVSYTLSKAENNVGEFFFSSPIDPFDLSKDWGRSDDDQRHRLVVHGTVQSSTAPPRSWKDRLTGGFQFGAFVQAYSALPFNITSGLTTIQGTPARPVVDGEFIPRNAGVGSRFFSVNLRATRTFRIAGRAELEAIAEAFNVTNHVNVVTRNTNFGAGAYPSNPSPAFGQVTSVGEPRAFQFGARLRF